MNHDELVRRAERWLYGTMRMQVVIAEPAGACVHEIPDVIGWNSRHSVLVECKATRGDFLRDRRKWFRSKPEAGMGDMRWFFAPPGLIKIEELPEGWGLAEVRGKQVRKVKRACMFTFFRRCNKLSEITLLVKEVGDLRRGLMGKPLRPDRPIVLPDDVAVF